MTTTRVEAVSVRARSFALYSMLAMVLGTTCTGATIAEPHPTVASGFTVDVIAHVSSARELVALPDGDLLVGTLGHAIAIVPNATGDAGAAQTFVSLPDEPAAGLTFADGELFFGSQFGVWKTAYATGDRTARETPHRIAAVRTSGVSSDHRTTSLAVDGATLYAGVGSSCNTCDPELDATRASIQAMELDGANVRPRAIRIRNPIALAVDPATRHLWAGVAGQDELAHGHPYEIFDDVTSQATPVANYGWPSCYEDRRPVSPDRDCSNAAVPRVVFPAYETPIGAAFYPDHPTGAHAFPKAFCGGAFVTLHGSWHTPHVPPRVVFVPFRGGEPATAPDWQDPSKQWREFLGGFQSSGGDRIGRPTGVAVGPDGSLFVADDDAGVVYRIRPAR